MSFVRSYAPDIAQTYEPGKSGGEFKNQPYAPGESGGAAGRQSTARGDFDGITLSDHPLYGPAHGHNRCHLSGEWIVEAGAASVRSSISAAQAAALWEQAVASAVAALKP
ncbi:hypothetical protein R4036_004574 [Salmonella enterica]|nr:hypothetical protein [Salmonella enterica]